jgi:hypothetical protein
MKDCFLKPDAVFLVEDLRDRFSSKVSSKVPSYLGLEISNSLAA